MQENSGENGGREGKEEEDGKKTLERERESSEREKWVYTVK